MNNNRTIPPLNDAKTVKKFFASSLRGIFHDDSPQCRYSSGDIVVVLRNAISLSEYIETYVRNNTSVRTPSGDTVFRQIKDIGLEAGSHRRNGSQPGQRTSSHRGTDTITELIDLTIRIAIANGSFMHPVNVAIDEHDEPYYGMDNRYLINAPDLPPSIFLCLIIYCLKAFFYSSTFFSVEIFKFLSITYDM